MAAHGLQRSDGSGHIQHVHPTVVRKASRFSEFSLYDSHAYPARLIKGPNRMFRFILNMGTALGMFEPAGTVKVLPISSYYLLNTITIDTKQNIWFTAISSSYNFPDQVGYVTPSGKLHFFSVPSLPGVLTNSSPSGITVGPDGNIWFGISENNQIGRITAGGKITMFTLPLNLSSPDILTRGPDGALWFTVLAGNRIGRIAPNGTITSFPLPQASTNISALTLGPDQALWFTDTRHNQIGRMTTAGVFSTFTIPTAHCEPAGITNFGDGTLAFTEFATNKVGRIATDGSLIQEFVVPTPHSMPADITNAGHGVVLFTEYNTGLIGKLKLV
ncbi:virginiamycin B lyase [Tengunoibacter tsumagoiensis]|uniref:Virginiamycin B lyase n=2 Tax=Tengunoibacter tsumagoiensis TaxID=2014871 RepID=A0A402A5L1_9CHLR|nr:virginiamycin B lyase [Tengunoibacter tsumagoiensis]